MKALGIICEYNPFHLGHLYQLNETKKMAKPDVVVGVMSGNYMQRGEVALIDKWTRAKIAVMNGVDLVVELPFCFSAQCAEIFAKGGILTLKELGIKSISFGSESGSIQDINKLAKIMSEEDEEYRKSLRENLDKGSPFFKARSVAISSLASFIEDSTLISKSNNILGLEYIKASNSLGLDFDFYTIKRIGAEYNDQTFKGIYSSATAIRRQIFNNSKDFLNALPKKSLDFFEEVIDKYGPNSNDALVPIIKYLAKIKGNNLIVQIADVVEGLENRIVSSISTQNTFDSIVDSISTKRYSRTRIQRILLAAVMDFRSSEMAYIKELSKVPYIRVLAFNQKGQSYLSKIKKEMNIPLTPKISPQDSMYYVINERADSIYYSLFPKYHILNKQNKPSFI